MSVKGNVAGLAAAAFFRLGLQQQWPRGPLILMYHRFRADGALGNGLLASVFAAQIATLVRSHTIVTLGELARRIADSEAPLESLAVITIDDGYHCFHEVALPALRRFRVPATLFLPYSFINEGDWMWQDRNKHVLYGWTGGPVEVVHCDRSFEVDTRTQAARYESLEIVYEYCRGLDMAAREEFAFRLAAACGMSLPPRPIGWFAPLSWAQVREAIGAGVEIGSHTVRHEILPSVDRELAGWEISESRRLLSSKLGMSIDSFAYPDGSLSPRDVDLVAAAGYRCAVTTVGGWVRRGCSLHALPRLSPPARAGRMFARLLLFGR